MNGAVATAIATAPFTLQALALAASPRRAHIGSWYHDMNNPVVSQAFTVST